MKTVQYKVCLILIQIIGCVLTAKGQTPATPPPGVVNTITTTPVASPTTGNSQDQKDKKEELDKPGRYEEYQSICRKNEYDLPATLSEKQKEIRINNLKNKIKASAKSMTFKYQLLKEYIDQKNKKAAVDYVAELKKEELNSADSIILTQSLSIFEKSKFNAEKELVKITTDNPKNIEALKVLAEIYKSQDKFSDVTTVYEDLAKITKLKYDEQLCEMYVMESYFKDAERYCHSAIKQNPNNPFPYIFLGVLFRETNKENEAAEMFKQSLKLGKTEMALVCLGELSALKKDYKTASEFYRQARQLKPMSSRAVLGQAWAELYANKYVESLTSFKLACGQDKKYLIEFRKAAKYLNERKNENAAKFITESQNCGVF